MIKFILWNLRGVENNWWRKNQWLVFFMLMCIFTWRRIFFDLISALPQPMETGISRFVCVWFHRSFLCSFITSSSDFWMNVLKRIFNLLVTFRTMTVLCTCVNVHVWVCVGGSRVCVFVCVGGGSQCFERQVIPQLFSPALLPR